MIVTNVVIICRLSKIFLYFSLFSYFKLQINTFPRPDGFSFYCAAATLLRDFERDFLLQWAGKTVVCLFFFDNTVFLKTERLFICIFCLQQRWAETCCVDGHCNEPSGTESFCERLSVGLPELFYKEVVGAVSCPPSLCVGFSLSPAKTVPGLEFFRLDGGKFADRKLLRKVFMSENRRRYVFVLISRRLDFRLGTCGEARRVRISGAMVGGVPRRGVEECCGVRISTGTDILPSLFVGRVVRFCVFFFCLWVAWSSLGGACG